MWNIHRVRRSRFACGPFGRPTVLHDIPTAFGGEACLIPVPADEIADCFNECALKEDLPCCQDFHDLCVICMEEQQLTLPHNAQDALNLYLALN